MLLCEGPSGNTDIHSLSCNIMVKTHTIPPQPWCEGQCSVDGESFLQYDNDNKATPLGDLGKAAHGTQMWTDFVQELESLGQEFRKILANTKLGTTEIHGHPTLQAMMLSKYEQGQVFGASWRFNISGNYSVLLNTTNMSWTPISLESRDIMNEWKNNGELTIYLKIFIANFSHWLKELFKCHRERTKKNRQLPMYCPINCYKSQRKERPMEPSAEFPNQATKMLSQEDEPETLRDHCGGTEDSSTLSTAPVTPVGNRVSGRNHGKSCSHRG
ncbi:hypothetical protein STEG23_034253 [Scotinomys teguina]